jgi:hypothetical protein
MGIALAHATDLARWLVLPRAYYDDPRNPSARAIVAIAAA